MCVHLVVHALDANLPLTDALRKAKISSHSEIQITEHCTISFSIHIEKTPSMAKALHKVQKQISKKRGGEPNSLHENSRDSQRLRRAGAREDKIARLVAAASRANQTYGETHH